MLDRVVGALARAGLVAAIRLCASQTLPPAQALFLGLVSLAGLVVAVEHRWYCRLLGRQKRRPAKRDRPMM